MATQSVSPTVSWQQWRHARDAEFADPYGWLSLTALEWLGTEPAAVAGAPGRWWADADGFHVEAAGPSLLIDGRPVSDSVLVCSLPSACAGRVKTPALPALPHGRLVVWDGAGEAPAVIAGERRLELLVRGLLRGVRVRDPQAPALQAFAGVPVFDYDPGWRLPATWRPYESAEQLSVAAVVPGLRYPQLVVGEVSFEVAGRTHVLKVNDGEWIAFRDASNGVDTTRHCRWVEVAVASDGTAVVDFNFAANPPCAFTDFGTCPLPPDGNHLPVPVLAGERDPRPGTRA